MLKKILLIYILGFLLTACGKASEKISGPIYGEKSTSNVKTYSLAIHPLHNPKKLSEAYQPLINHLNNNIPEAQFELESSRDYQAFEEKFRRRTPAIILPNPWQTLEAMKNGYKVISMAGDAKDFKGIFIVRKDSGINTPTDLKGKIVTYPSYTALAACIMPQRYLHDNGVNVMKDIENRYVGSQESSIMNVFLGESAAGATWPPPWRLFQRDQPEKAAKLKVIWETPSLMNNSVMVRDDVPNSIINKVSELILTLHTHKNGKKILDGMSTAQFHKANDDSYKPVRDFVDEFEKNVRTVEINE